MRNVYHWNTGGTSYDNWTSVSEYDVSYYVGGSQISPSSIDEYKGSTKRTITVKVYVTDCTSSPATTTVTQNEYYERVDPSNTTTVTSLNALSITPSATSLNCAGGSITFTAEAEYEEEEYYDVYNTCNRVVGKKLVSIMYPKETVNATYSVTQGGSYATINGSTLTVGSNSSSSDVSIVVRGSYTDSGYTETNTATITLKKCPTSYTITANPSSLTCKGGSIQFTAKPK